MTSASMDVTDSQNSSRNGSYSGKIVNKQPLFRVSEFLHGLGRSLYLLFAVVLILSFSYLFGHAFLEGNLSGNDIPWALSLVQWYDRWFPNIPLWFPLQGAGTPIFFLYPPGINLLVVIFHRLSSLTLIQSFRLIAFLSIPIAGLGIYFIVRTKIKSQTIALIAALLYPLSPATWDWLTRVGLYGQSVSIMIVPWAFLAFDSCLTQALQVSTEKKTFRQRLMFPIAVFLFSFMFVAHIPTALSFVMGIVAYALLLPLLQRMSRPNWRSVLHSVFLALMVIVVGLALAAAWIVPFIQTNLLANREGLSYIPAEQVSSYNFLTTFGITKPEPAYMMTFAAPVVILAGIGIVAGLIKREVPLSWGLIAVGSVLFVAMPGLWMGFVKAFAPLWEATNDRAILVAFVLLPATAAYGAYGVGRLIINAPFSLVQNVVRKRFQSDRSQIIIDVLKRYATSFVALIVAAMMVIYVPKLITDRNGYGMQYWNGPFPITIENGQIDLLDPPAFELSKEGDLTNRDDILAFTYDLNFTSKTRLDVSPNLGGITEALSLYSDASIVNIYAFNSSLIHGMWGYQTKAFYTESSRTITELNELAKWFGFQYIVLHKNLDPVDKYDPSTWPLVYPKDINSTSIVQVHQNLNAPEMVSLLSTPTILLIGGYENAVYEQAFRVFVEGALPFEQGVVVEGVHDVDDYSLEELNEFDVLVLHGYGYKKQKRAWKILEEYVDYGGALYIDTGWQFFTPDWELTETPTFLPVNNLAWSTFDKADSFILVDETIIGEINVNNFSPLIWEDQPWGVSVPTAGVKNWAQPIININEKPIVVAGLFGQGRVVWSGMNLIGHVATYDNPSERVLINQLINWLTSQPLNDVLPVPIVEREHPDHIRFTFDGPIPEGASLLWREAYSPGWHASVTIGGQRLDIPIYRAGPGMMLLMLPVIDAPNSVIEMDFKMGWSLIAGISISCLTLTALIAIACKPNILSGISRRVRNLTTPGYSQSITTRLEDITFNKDETNGGLTSSDEEAPIQITNDILNQPMESGNTSDKDNDEGEVEAFWSSYVKSQNEQSNEERDASQLINLWRQSRSDESQ